jgi:hypothetical protein
MNWVTSRSFLVVSELLCSFLYLHSSLRFGLVASSGMFLSQFPFVGREQLTWVNLKGDWNRYAIREQFVGLCACDVHYWCSSRLTMCYDYHDGETVLLCASAVMLISCRSGCRRCIPRKEKVHRPKTHGY